MIKLSVLDQSPIRTDATPADAVADTLYLAENDSADFFTELSLMI